MKKFKKAFKKMPKRILTPIVEDTRTAYLTEYEIGRG